jgi:hypothetical protein
MGNRNPFAATRSHISGYSFPHLGTLINTDVQGALGMLATYSIITDAQEAAILAGHNTLNDFLDYNEQSAAASILFSAGLISDADEQAIVNGQVTLDDIVGISQGYAPPSTPKVPQVSQPPKPADPMQDPGNPAAWYDLLGKLQQSNLEIQNLEAQVRQSPVLARAIGSQVIALRQEYVGNAANFTQLYVTVFGEAPAGLAGLGQVLQILIGAGVFIALMAGIYALIQHIANTKIYAQQALASAQAGSQVAQNQATIVAQAQGLIAQAAKMRSAGNTAGATQLEAQARSMIAEAALLTPAAGPGAGLDLNQMVTQYGPWVLLAFVAMTIVPPLIKKL